MEIDPSTMNRHINSVAESGEVFVDGIVENFVTQ